MTTDELLSKMATVLQCGGADGYGFYARALLQPHFAFSTSARGAMEKALLPPPPTTMPSARRRVLEDDDELPVRRPTQPPTRRRASLFDEDE